MNAKRRLLYVVTWAVVASVVAGGAAYFLKLNFWLAFFITATALVLNGIVAEIEDRRSGGFLDPRKRK